MQDNSYAKKITEINSEVQTITFFSAQAISSFKNILKSTLKYILKYHIISKMYTFLELIFSHLNKNK